MLGSGFPFIWPWQALVPGEKPSYSQKGIFFLLQLILSNKFILLSFKLFLNQYFQSNRFTTAVFFIRVVPTVINPVAYLLKLQADSIISASVRPRGWAQKFDWKNKNRKRTNNKITQIYYLFKMYFLFRKKNMAFAFN